ncbi:hypothetical protein RBB50_000714 [Rhinocladiella similis]
MAFRLTTRLILAVVLLLILIHVLSNTNHGRRAPARKSDGTLLKAKSVEVTQKVEKAQVEDVTNIDVLPPSHLLVVDDDGKPVVDKSVYREIFSNSTSTGNYFGIHLGGVGGFNPTIIPHPTRFDSWIVVTQRIPKKDDADRYSQQLVCNAGFLNDVLVCAAEPIVISVDSTKGDCKDELGYLNFQWGPRDARAFYGPTAPYLLYSGHSSYTCMGMWMEDLRMLVDDYRIESVLAKDFSKATEIQKPPPLKGLEKNFFLFWDNAGEAYVHSDLVPKRVFAKLSPDGSVGPDLAPVIEDSDKKCMKRYMPKPVLDEALMQQATNTLAITMCRRTDPKCVQNDQNTYIVNIFHYKSHFAGHSIYEPYVMLFQQTAPFAMHAISTKPLWIAGRSKFSKFTGAVNWQDREDYPENHSEMFYIRGMSWKSHGQKYHGYLDDVLFLTFGIEDSRPAAIDVMAADLLQDLGLCANAK